MFFRSVIFFRFPTAAGVMPSSFGTAIDEALDEAVAEGLLKPVGPLEMSTRGFVSPYGRDSEVYTQRAPGVAGICVGGEDKILPAAVINDLLAKKIDEVLEQEGRAPGGRTRKRMKEELVHELLPRAFVQPSRTSAFFDFKRGLICIDHSSRKVAEQVVSQVRYAIGSFPALALNAQVAPRATLTGWLGGEELPEGLSLGDDCELREASDTGHIVRITNGDLQGDEVAKHLEAGMQCTRLALTLDDHLSFTFGEDLVVRRLKFLDGAVDKLDQVEREDLRAELDARFFLNVAEIQRLFDMLEKAFRISSNDEEDAALAAATPAASTKGAARRAAKNLQQMAEKHGVTMTISHGDQTLATFNGDPQLSKGEQLIDRLSAVVDPGDADPLYPQAVEIVRDNERSSISHLQRHLKIGYNRAARLIERMEAEGVLSAPNAAGTRTILPNAKDSNA